MSHKKLRLFVSHVGQNSLYEAAYRGVPLVAIPLFGDQPDNAKLVEFRGFGLSLDYQKLTADDMQSTIERVLKEPRYFVFALTFSSYPFSQHFNFYFEFRNSYILTNQLIFLSYSVSVKTPSAFHA